MKNISITNVSKPSRYIGHEINAIKKDLSHTEVSVALAFPDVYEVGMSHQGMKILYNILNSHDWIAAERVFTPWLDMEEELKNHNDELTSLESGLPLSGFDIIGFSLQHELCYTNVLTMLHLSGIPFLSAQRDFSYPLIIAGGPASFNPEPIADIFDVFVIGDGELVLIEICKIVRDSKHTKRMKEDILFDLSELKGVYVPSLFEVDYLPGGAVDHVRPKRPGYTKVEKAVIPDIDKHPFPAQQVVPFTQLIHDRMAIEISRGCTRGCRFCQAGMIYRPVRERHPESVIKNLEKGLNLTGFDEVSLLSLSSGDYSCIGPLIKELMDRQSNSKVALSLPSLRIDSLDPSWFEQIRRVRKTGFTMAPEAGNDRLRMVLNKAMTNDDILEMAKYVYDAGWNLIKLYFMIGLPQESDKDLKDIADIAKEVANLAHGGKKKRAVLNVSVSTFVPKAHTPFMWVPQISLEESRKRIKYVRDKLRKERSIRVKWNQPELSWLEGVFSRGDRCLTIPLIKAWQQGARFDAWGDCFDIFAWEKAFKTSGIDPALYHRQRSIDETLPWDHIDSGVLKEFLLREWKRALEGKHTPDCREKCIECGVCDHKEIDPLLIRDWKPASTITDHSFDCPSPTKKYRVSFSKTGISKYLSHLELYKTLLRALRRIDLKIAFSNGFHPMPQLSFASALPVGTESLDEVFDIGTYESIEPQVFTEMINHQLPDGIRINSISEIATNKKNPRLVESYFHIFLNGIEPDQKFLDLFWDAQHFPVVKTTKKGDKKEINAKELVKSVCFVSKNQLELVIRHVSGPEIKPIDIVREIFQIKDKDLGNISILKIKQVLDQ